ncbi:MAG: hypothetical protein KAH16_03920 [Candidatus Izimaplasma sp.]|nr:hypothetical protein [Candidatus Izimaplasma bacterium]
MRKRLSLFNISLFSVFVVFLIRQIFNMSRISRIILGNSGAYGIVFLVVTIVLGFTVIYLFYYLPILFAFQIVILIDYNFTKISYYGITNKTYEYKEQFLNRVNYHKLRVYRC